MYTKVNTHFEDFSKVFAKLSDTEQEKLVKMAFQLLRAHSATMDDSAIPAIKQRATSTKQKTAKKSETK